MEENVLRIMELVVNFSNSVELVAYCFAGTQAVAKLCLLLLKHLTFVGIYTDREVPNASVKLR